MARRVLVVDDERGVREALRQTLEYEGLEVRAVDSGTEALMAFAVFLAQNLVEQRALAAHETVTLPRSPPE